MAESKRRAQEEISKGIDYVQGLGQQSSKGDEDEKKKKKLRPDQLPDAIFEAVFRVLPAYKRAIDGTKYDQKQEAWREITAKLLLDPELRRQLGGQAVPMLAKLDPTILMRRFNIVKHNAYAALKSSII
jgi:hypothetical protein